MKFSNPEDWNKFIERTLYYYDNSNKEFQPILCQMFVEYKNV